MNSSDSEKKPALTCEVCMKEIPHSVAQSLEGSDYIHHFCGNECFSKWDKEKPDEERTSIEKK